MFRSNFQQYPNFDEQFPLGTGSAQDQLCQNARAVGQALATGAFTIEYAINPASAPRFDATIGNGYYSFAVRHGQCWLDFGSFDVAVYPLPPEVAQLFADMIAAHEIERGGEKLRAYWQQHERMEREVARDPEGAFGGRGNNILIP